MIDQLLRLLTAAGIEVGEKEAADALWLAGQMGVGEPVPPPSEVTAPPLPENPQRPAEQPVEVPPRDLPSARRVPISENSVTLHLPPSTDHSVNGVGGHELRSPGTYAVPGALRLSRSLRPLKRLVPDARQLVLDEAATVSRIADTGLWIPEQRPKLTRWLELALVVDSGASMTIWRRTAMELRALLERLGAFRDLRVWEVDTDSATPTGPILRKASATHTAASTRSPRELVDPGGRRLVLVFSDCVGPAWHTGSMSRLLGTWASAGPVAVVQPLPYRLWGRSGTPPVSVRLRTCERGTTSPRLEYQVRRQRFGAPPPRDRLPVPVMELTPRWMAPWARLLGGGGSGWVNATALLVEDSQARSQAASPVDTEPAESAKATDAVESAATPMDRVRAFRAGASPAAFELACYLATVPLNLPVMRLVQQTMLEEPRPAHLAEVFLGGLLHQVGPRTADERVDEVQYEFDPGIREVLLRGLLRTDILRVYEAVSTFVGARMGHPLDFHALLADPNAVDLPRLPQDSRPFARVAVEVLRALGPPYASAAPRLLDAMRDGPGPGDRDDFDLAGATLAGSDASGPPEGLAAGTETSAITARQGERSSGSQIWLGFETGDAGWGNWIKWELDRAGYAVSNRSLVESAAATAGTNQYVLAVISSAQPATSQLRALLASPDGPGRTIVISVDAGPLPAEALSWPTVVRLAGTSPAEARASILDSLAEKGAHPVRSGRPTMLKLPPPAFPGQEAEPHEMSGLGPVWVLASVRSRGRWLLARGGADGLVRMLDATTGQNEVNLEGHVGPVRALAAIPGDHPGMDHRWLASGGVDGIVRTWNLENGSLERQARFLEGEVWALVPVHVDGQLCLAGTGSESKIQLWDPGSGRRIRTLSKPGSRVWALAPIVVGGRELLASGGADGTILLWDPETAEVIQTLQAHRSTVWALASVRVGAEQLLASGGADGMIHLWRPGGGSPVRSFAGHASTIRTLTVLSSDGGDILASGSADSTVRLWNPNSNAGMSEQVFNHHTGEVWALAPVEVRGELRLASGGVDGTIRVADPVSLRTDELYSVPSSSVWALASVELDDRTVLTTGGMDGAVHLIDLSTYTELGVLIGHRSTVRSLAAVPDHHSALLASGAADGTVRLWDVRTGEGRKVYRGHTGEVWAVTSVEAQGHRFVASGSADGTIRLWPVAGTDEDGVVLRGPAAEIVALTTVPARNGPLLASTSSEGTVVLWDVSTERLQQTLHGGSSRIAALAVVPHASGSWLAGACMDGTIAVWDMAEPGEAILLNSGTGHIRTLTVIDIAGRALLASGGFGGKVQFWDLATRECVAAIPRHSGTIRALTTVSLGDRALLASASDEGDCLLWEPNA